MKKQNKFPQIFIQINIGEEEQKFGILPKESNNFIKFCREDLGLEIYGVMAIPPKDEDPSLYFSLLRKIAIENNIKNISMGMSLDYEKAVALGANFIRIGTAIFGQRNLT